MNVPSYRHDTSSTDGVVLSNKNGSSSPGSQLSWSHVRGSPGPTRYDVCSTRDSISNVQDCNVSLDAASVAATQSEVDTTAMLCKDPLQLGFMDSSDVCYDTLVCKAYGSSLSQLSSVGQDSDWRSHWRQVVYHLGNHYILPSGSIGWILSSDSRISCSEENSSTARWSFLSSLIAFFLKKGEKLLTKGENSQKMCR